MASNTTCGGEIGEETQTNTVNETKTIKEKRSSESEIHYQNNNVLYE